MHPPLVDVHCSAYLDMLSEDQSGSFQSVQRTKLRLINIGCAPGMLTPCRQLGRLYIARPGSSLRPRLPSRVLLVPYSKSESVVGRAQKKFTHQRT